LLYFLNLGGGGENPARQPPIKFLARKIYEVLLISASGGAVSEVIRKRSPRVIHKVPHIYVCGAWSCYYPRSTPYWVKSRLTSVHSDERANNARVQRQLGKLQGLIKILSSLAVHLHISIAMRSGSQLHPKRF